MTERRIIKSPFTKEERHGVFVSIEGARERRTLKNNKDKEYMYNINNQTEDQFKESLRQAMYDDIKYTPCGCNICIEGHKKFLEDEDAWLEVRWQDHVEDMDREPCSDEELDEIFAEQGIVLDRKTGRINLINK